MSALSPVLHGESWVLGIIEGGAARPLSQGEINAHLLEHDALLADRVRLAALEADLIEWAAKNARRFVDPSSVEARLMAAAREAEKVAR